jgi:protein-S-isoprenylcysteine O-methyltransferase Ste14
MNVAGAMSADGSLPIDPYLVVRTGSIYVVMALTALAWAWRRPSARVLAGAILGSLWHLPVLLAIHLTALQFGWWTFDARGGLLLGLPVDLYLSWAWLWGGLPLLAWPSAPLPLLTAIALALDLVIMPLCEPVLRLGPNWLVAEAIGLALGFVPGQLLARWTARNEHLEGRATLQVLTFAGLVLFVLPAAILEGSGSAWRNPLTRPAWQLSVLAQLLAVPALLGVSAVQEFVSRGRGTPVPFDPPNRIVTTGIYAYVRNPMQLSGVLVLLTLGAILQNAWIAAGGVMAHLYSTGLAGWDEDADLVARFGTPWKTYRHNVRRWIPRWRPWAGEGAAPAQLFVSERCDMCRQVGRWFVARDARHLAVVAAETHPRRLTRITYEPGDGTPAATGVLAIARALEHVHLAWAMVGFALRLPVVHQLAQLLVDASGGEPRLTPASSIGRGA